MVWQTAFSTFGYSTSESVCIFLIKIKFVINDFSFSDGLEAFIGSDRKMISLANLVAFPPFLRLNEVRLEYASGSQSLLAKFRLFEDCLDSIKSALNDSNKIRFDANINRDHPSHFNDHSSLVIYLRDRLLPICGSSRRYNFNIEFDFGNSAVSDVISSILQISKVRNCSHVQIDLFGYNYILSARLPVDDISNWLAPKTDDCIGICGKEGENRFLSIYCTIIPNAQEMWNYLKEVI